MSYFSDDFIQRVRLASDIISLIGEDVTLKGQGDRHTGLCPFPDHTEKTPSFFVSSSKQVYHCFGCQKSGNIYTYLKELRGMNFVESVHYLARQARIDIPTSYEKKGQDVTGELFNLNEKACQFYQKKLFECSMDSPVWKYLNKRGYSKETIKKFRIGYAPKGKTLLRSLSGKEQNQAVHLGLLAKDQSGNGYDNFRNRLIFPIVSTRKQVIGFGARALDDSLPKYINSKESKVFYKGTSFYGLNESARYLRQKGFLIIVEGYTDFLSLWQEGFQNIVATLGTALTEDHAKLLKRYVDTVIVVFDGDDAGLKAAERSLPLLLLQSLEVKSILLPNKQDPDSFIKESGRESFEALLKKSKDLFFQILQRKQVELKTQGRSLIYLLEEMLPFLESTAKETLKVIYKQRTLDLFGSDKKSMERVLDKFLKNSSKTFSHQRRSSENSEKKTAIERFSLSKALEAERLLLVLCLDSQSFLDLFLKKSGMEVLKTKEIIAIFEKIETRYRQKPKDFDRILPDIMHELSDNFLLLKQSYPVLNGAKEEDKEKVFQDSLSFLKKRQISAKVHQVISEIKMDDQEDMKQLEKVFQLTKEKLRQKDFSN